MLKKCFAITALLALLTACECGLDGCKDDGMMPSSPGSMDTEMTITESEHMGDPFPTADRVYYGTNLYNLTPESQAILGGQAMWLKRNPGVHVIIEGHCDERGTREYNLGLGERRANGAKDYLVSLGVSPSRITTISYGKDRPIVLGSTPEDWALNRTSIAVVQ